MKPNWWMRLFVLACGLIAALLLVSLITGCVATTGDLDKISQALGDMKLGYATVEDVKGVVRDVRDDVKRRGDEAFEGLLTVAASLVGLGGAAYARRSYTRKKVLTEVQQ